MDKGEKGYQKRTQRDYSLAFKLKVVEEVEKGEKTYKEAQKEYGIQGKSTVLVWLRKHGRLDWKKESTMKDKSIPRKEIRDLKRQIERLKKEKEVLQIAIDIAEEELKVPIRKKYLAKLSKDAEKNEEESA
jgi:transposase-like protein